MFHDCPLIFPLNSPLIDLHLQLPLPLVIACVRRLYSFLPNHWLPTAIPEMVEKTLSPTERYESTTERMPSDSICLVSGLGEQE